MPTIPEDKLTFVFPDSWSAIKYDKDDDNSAPKTYYQLHLEPINGTKAVDIVAAPPMPANRFLLLEVKDFRLDDADLQRKIEEENFPLEVVQKVVHSLSGLYLGIRAQDSKLSPFAGHLLGLPLRLEVVLFLEQIPVARKPSDKGYKLALANRDTQRQGISKRLRSLLKPLGFDCFLFDTNSLPSNIGWEVHETQPSQLLNASA